MQETQTHADATSFSETLKHRDSDGRRRASRDVPAAAVRLEKVRLTRLQAEGDGGGE